MATDTFTCSRCGQLSYYRDGSYLFGQQIVCARCYAAQAAPQVPGAGVAPAAVPAAYPAAPAGYPGGPAPYPAQPPRANVCGLLGFLCAILAIGCVIAANLMLAKHKDSLLQFVEKVQKNPNDQEAIQREWTDWAQKHPDAMGGMALAVCGAPILVLVGLILSIVGVCLGNVRKGLAIAGLVLNGLPIIGMCLIPCLGGMVR